MLVSWNWLKDYVPLAMTPAEAATRLMMAGLNHESTTPRPDDVVIDLEVTSNRPDCLGHVGIAREISVLYGVPLKIPAAQPQAKGAAVASLASVSVLCPQLCPRYTARVIRGVKVGPSPAWLAKRLEAIGQPLVNNVVDVTNYVLMEVSQPLHAFDLAKLREGRIVVRESRANEEFLAINHKLYKLEAGTCVIADAQRPVALGGVMGGADTEVTAATRDVLIEAADFDPLSIRNTARRLNLRSDSSYRFERGVDPQAIDWASRRCCELILDLAGGELAEGVLDVGPPSVARPPISLRFSQLPRILGVDIPAEEVRRILVALGNREQSHNATAVVVAPPSWRRDLEREIDLVEEVARIHGYDKIPEDVGVPMAPSHRTNEERVAHKLRHVLTSAGYNEALTVSLVPADWAELFSPWTGERPLRARMPMLQNADHLRLSLVPSLLASLRNNEAVGNKSASLFEMARAYLPQPQALPREELLLTCVTTEDFYAVKAVVAALLAALNPEANLELAEASQPIFDAGRGCRLSLAGETLGYLGEVNAATRKRFDLRGRAVAAELRVAPLVATAVLVPKLRAVSEYPSIELDLNLVTPENVRWADLERTVRSAGGALLESLLYRETYRDAQKDGPGQKRLLFSITLRSHERTLTGDEAEQVRHAIVAACGQSHQCKLLA